MERFREPRLLALPLHPRRDRDGLRVPPAEEQQELAENASVRSARHGRASCGIFVVAWILQFIGHKIEGKKPSFFQDLVFLLIGPLWTLSFFYKKLGIKI